MVDPVLVKIEALARQPEALAESINYVAEHLGKFLRKQDHVLICVPVQTADTLGGIMEQAVLRTGAVPTVCGPDYRWRTLLRQAFSARATAIIGPPMIILGLTKLARATGTPLYIRNVVTIGYFYEDWMFEGIRRGLDCDIWGCLGFGIGSVVTGFSCTRVHGLHLREGRYGLEILDAQGHPLPDGESGQVVLYPRTDPSLRFPIMVRGHMAQDQCPCGDTSPRFLIDGQRLDADPVLAKLGSELLSWSSVLDCRLEKGESGLEMELVTFPGAKLPKLPTCAKRVIRPWDPEKDTPFWIPPGWKKDLFPGKTIDNFPICGKMS